MKTVNSKKRRGTALLESIIAIGVILVGVVGALVLLNTSINLGRANQDRIVGQNLAREGLELAYSLRNSGAMRSVDKPFVNWFSFLHQEVYKTNSAQEYLKKYNFGDVDGGVCKQICPPNTDPNCTTTSDDQYTIDGINLLFNEDIEDARQCDLDAVEQHLVQPSQWGLPPGCDDAYKAGICSQGGVSLCMTDASSGCDFNLSGRLDLSDISLLHNIFFLQSFQFGYGYPSHTSLTSNAAGILEFNTNFSNYNPTAGQYLSLNPIWEDPKARLYTDASESVYVQNSTAPNLVPSKFYRVVSVQQICRGTRSGTSAELVIEPTSALNCVDYIAANDGPGQPADGWDAEAEIVGALVTSEVRWPTPTSSTKVRYQEYMYDWLTL